MTQISILERLVETILSRAEDEAAWLDPGDPAPNIDRRPVWAAAGPTERAEDSAGRIVLAAEQAAARLVDSARSRMGSGQAQAVSHDPAGQAGAAGGWSAPAGPIGRPRPAVRLESPPEPRRETASERLAFPPAARESIDPSAPTVTMVEPAPPSPDRPGQRGRQRAIGVATLVRNLGAILLVFVAYQLWGTSLQQHRSQHQLERQFVANLRGPAGLGSSPGRPALGSAVARLQIAKLGVDEYVVEGTGVEDLKKGPGHYAGTPLPGQRGDAAIAGHRTTYGAPFNRLDELAPGDMILTTTAAGGSRYQVSEKPKAVSPGDTQVVSNLGDDRLTLTTCTPKYSAARRLVLVAKLLPPSPGADQVPVSPPQAPSATRPVVVNTGDLAWHWGQLLPCLIVAAALVALARARNRVRSVFGPSWWLVIVIPIWAAGLLLLFEALGRLLPANV